MFEEIITEKSISYFKVFATRAAEKIRSSPSILYTDFIADISPNVSCLAEVGVEAVGYHGEINPLSRHESYLNWTSGHVQVIVATKAFGLGM